MKTIAMLNSGTDGAMVQIGVSEARGQMDALLDRVLAGEHVVILRGREEVARMLPVKNQVPTEAEQKRAALAAERIRSRAKALGGRFDWEELKQLRDEGR